MLAFLYLRSCQCRSGVYKGLDRIAEEIILHGACGLIVGYEQLYADHFDVFFSMTEHVT